MTRYADASAIPVGLMVTRMATSERDGTEEMLLEREEAFPYRPVRFTGHARYRGAQRNVVSGAVDYVLAHGRPIHRTGVIFYFLARRDVPPADLRLGWAARLIGTVVMVSRDGAVITMYRNRHALRTILRKMKYRIPELSATREASEEAAEACDLEPCDPERATA